MTVDMHAAIARRRPDAERARSWLERQLEWEAILAALREAGEG
jgi:hypothetical protein